MRCSTSLIQVSGMRLQRLGPAAQAHVSVLPSLATGVCSVAATERGGCLPARSVHCKAQLHHRHWQAQACTLRVSVSASLQCIRHRPRRRHPAGGHTSLSRRCWEGPSKWACLHVQFKAGSTCRARGFRKIAFRVEGLGLGRPASKNRGDSAASRDPLQAWMAKVVLSLLTHKDGLPQARVLVKAPSGHAAPSLVSIRTPPEAARLHLGCQCIKT